MVDVTAIATARPKRGKYHRDDGYGRWACSGLPIREGDVHKALVKTDPFDRCRICWRPAPAGSVGGVQP